MKFRPCIDIHNGKVKQIVGGSLQDAGNRAKENFVSEMSAADYADLYKKKNLRGGHVILLNPAGSEYYEEDRRQAEEALAAYPEGLQVGGGITVENDTKGVTSVSGKTVTISASGSYTVDGSMADGQILVNIPDTTADAPTHP